MLKQSFSNKIEAGCDEAGRGCLAGPVFAAVVILPKGFKNNLLNDSKKLNKKQRDELRVIIENEVEHWAVGSVSNIEIDEINILNASYLAMHRAIDKLLLLPELLLIDGNRFNKYKNIRHECIIKGDGKYMSIAAASILAKTHRDEFMENAALEHPQYKWASNKGYPTREHKMAIMKYGYTSLHRRTFNANIQMKMDF
jgi:ribonuclease HII